MKHLAIITARGGSKGIPRKNVRDVGGAPLIAFTLSVAGQARCFDRVFLSTDSDEILSVCSAWGLSTPYRRPTELADDHSTSRDVVLHALEYLAWEEDYVPDFVTILQPTSPFRTNVELAEYAGIAERAEHLNAGVVSVSDVGHFHPRRMFTLEGGFAVRLQPSYGTNPRRQDLGPTYVMTGGYFGFKPSVVLNTASCLADRLLPFFIRDPLAVLNIDEPFDLEVADLFMRYSSSTRALQVRDELGEYRASLGATLKGGKS